METNGASASHTPLVPEERSAEYSQRWQAVQAEFVDEPQQAVKDADGLVAEVIQMLAKNFAEQRQGLEEQWSQGTEVSTEDLRQALMQYRSFFQRLLAA
jgi:serine phosphatase RsbU (regulator of sigma subunit)